MRKNILIFTLSLVFVVGGFRSVLAYTESECNSRGGTCQSTACGNSGNTIGSCWESGNASFNRINCCGNASTAQQQSPIINPGGNTSNGGSSGSSGVSLPTNVGLPSGNLTSVISNITNWILGIFGFVAIISFLVSGMMYFFSAGDDKSQEKAKKQMTWSIMGVVIGLIGLVVIYTVDMFLNAGGASFGGSSSVINSAANSPATGAVVPNSTPTPSETPTPSGSGSGWAPTSDKYTTGGNPPGNPDEFRPENNPF